MTLNKIAVLSLLRKKNLHGLGLHIEAPKYGIELSLGGIYNTLKALEKEGLVTHHTKPSKSTKGGNKTKMYQLTLKGHAIIKGLHIRILKLADIEQEENKMIVPRQSITYSFPYNHHKERLINDQQEHKNSFKFTANYKANGKNEIIAKAKKLGLSITPGEFSPYGFHCDGYKFTSFGKGSFIDKYSIAREITQEDFFKMTHKET